MTGLSTRDWTISTIAGIARCPQSRIVDDARLDDIGVDSIGVLELTMSAEDEFGVRITDDEVYALDTVGSALVLIGSKRAASATGVTL